MTRLLIAAAEYQLFLEESAVDRIDAVLFARLVESGSFSVAAREVGCGQSTASKRVAALEAQLGVRLLLRTSRSLRPTDQGLRFYRAALHVLDAFAAAETSVGDATLTGIVRITCAPVFGRFYVLPLLPEIFSQHPGVSVELVTSERVLDLVKEGIDLAIRNGEGQDSTLVTRTLYTSSRVTVASPNYLERHGTPITPGDLKDHSCIGFVPAGEVWPYTYQTKEGPVSHRPSGSFRTGDAEAVRGAVIAGIGLIQGPEWLFAPELAEGSLTRVLDDIRPTGTRISAVHPAGRYLPERTKIVLDALSTAIRSANWKGRTSSHDPGPL